jgi:hypothetical protein
VGKKDTDTLMGKLKVDKYNCINDSVGGDCVLFVIG